MIWIFHNPTNGDRRKVAPCAGSGGGFARNRAALAFPLCAVVSRPNISSLKLVLDSNTKNKAATLGTETSPLKMARKCRERVRFCGMSS